MNPLSFSFLCSRLPQAGLIPFRGLLEFSFIGFNWEFLDLNSLFFITRAIEREIMMTGIPVSDSGQTDKGYLGNRMFFSLMWELLSVDSGNWRCLWGLPKIYLTGDFWIYINLGEVLLSIIHIAWVLALFWLLRRWISFRRVGLLNSLLMTLRKLKMELLETPSNWSPMVWTWEVLGQDKLFLFRSIKSCSTKNLNSKMSWSSKGK